MEGPRIKHLTLSYKDRKGALPSITLTGVSDDETAIESMKKYISGPLAGILTKARDRCPSPTSIDIKFIDTPSPPSTERPNDTPPPIEQADFEVQSPRWSLDRVVLPATTMQDLETVLTLLSSRDLMYRKWGLQEILRSTSSALTLNFYGASGTGKTLAAHAVAAHLGMKLVVVGYAELESRYVGQTPKNIRSAFALAEREEAAIFFDEADNVLGKRLTGVTQSADAGVNAARSVMLMELEKFRGICMFASNFVHNYDPAFTRRILHHVRFDLPDLECRRRIFELHLPARLPLGADVSAHDLAAKTEGFTGGEIRNVVLKAAAMAAAMRDTPEDERRVRSEMFAAAIESVRKAREAVDGGPAWMEKRLAAKASRSPE